MNRLDRGGRRTGQPARHRRSPFPMTTAFSSFAHPAPGCSTRKRSRPRSTSQPRKHLKNNGTIVPEIVRSVRPAVHAESGSECRLRRRRPPADPQVVLEHKRDPLGELDDRHRLVFERRLDALCRGPDRRAAARRRNGRQHRPRRQRDGLRDGASADKDFIVVEGATHNLGPCTECETRKGEYENATKNFFNYVARWLSSRY